MSIIKIPTQETKKWKVDNTTDLFGNIFYTRNINFDSEGLLKLAEGSIAIKSETGDSNFDTPTGFGDKGNSFYVSTIDQPFNLDLSGGNYSISEDTSTSNQSGFTRGHAKWWQDRWYVAGSSSLWYITSGTWTDPSVSLTSSLGHSIEVFKSRNTLCIANGNVVKQIDSSHSTSGQAQLTLPSELEVTSLSYSNGLLAIGTKNKQTNSGSNGTSAFFFIWDGTTSSANVGIAVDSTYVLAVSKYQEASFVCLTGAGQLLKFNGSGFDVLANLPFYYEGYKWVDSFPNYITRNGIIRTDGDKIFINIPNELQGYGLNGQRHFPPFNGGIYCYDPKVGLYHRYALSTSLVASKSFSSMDTATDIITVGSTITGAQSGMPVRYYASGTAIGGLVTGKLYYLIYVSGTTFKLATTYTNAMAGTAIDLSGSGSTFDYFSFHDMKEFGQSRTVNNGAIFTLGSGVRNLFGHMVWGAELNNVTADNDIATLGVTLPDLETRGYFVTPRIESSNITDIYQKLFIKFVPLVQDIDKIVVKYRLTKKNGFPYTVPVQNSTSSKGTWVDSDTFTSAGDLSNVAIGDEVEITAGTGSGQMAHVASITYNAGTYTVNLDEQLKYIVASDCCHFSVDNWIRLKTIDNTNVKGFVEIPIEKQSKWIQFKVELRGVAITIEELQLITKTQLPSV